MNENLRSILVGTAGLSVAAVAGLLLTLRRPVTATRPAMSERQASFCSAWQIPKIAGEPLFWGTQWIFFSYWPW